MKGKRIPTPKKTERIDLYNIPESMKKPLPKGERLDLYSEFERIYGKRQK